MTTTRVPSGVPTGGQFAASRRAEGTVVLTPTVPAVPERVAFIADDLVAMADSLWFPDHSYRPDVEDDEPDWEPEMVHLGHMDDPDVAANNCHAASYAAWEVIDDIDLDAQPNVARLTFSTSDPIRPVHFATTVVDPDTDQVWVIDFTARQYDPEVAFPLVEPLEAWRERIDGYVTERGWATTGFDYET